MKNKSEILEEYASATPSTWREKAEWRRENRQWLKKSQRIAILVMEHIENANMSQKALAEKMGIKPQYISKILRGNENLTLETISKLEMALNIEIVSINKCSVIQKMPSQHWSQQPKLTPVGMGIKNSLNYLEAKESNYNINLEPAA